MHDGIRRTDRKKIAELVRRATRASYYGATDYYPMSEYVSEFINRQRMAKLGFTSSFDDMPYLKTSIFVTIDATVEKIQADEMKKSQKKR